MSYKTLEDLANLNIEMNAPLSDGDILLDFIEENEASEQKARMDEGVSYFKVKNDILDEDFTAYTDEHGNPQNQPDKANNRLAFAFFRRQVIEKTAFLVKTPITVTHETDGIIDKIHEFIDADTFNEVLSDWIDRASYKGREWLHPFIYKEKFDYMLFDARQIIPIYETSRQKELVSAIRYYPVTVDETGTKHERYVVEWYQVYGIDKYIENNLGKIEFVETVPYFVGKKNGRETPKSWGKVPLVELRNNSVMMTDLEPIKTLVDSYDRSMSVLTNDLEDIQSAFFHISGTSDKASDVRSNLKKFKVAVSDEAEGKMTAFTVDIPSEARKMQLEKLEEQIFANGMSISTTQDEFGNSPSGVALKWLYVPLDQKAGLLELKAIKALKEFYWFLGEFLKQSQALDIKSDKIKVTFNKTMIQNEKEMW